MRTNISFLFFMLLVSCSSTRISKVSPNQLENHTLDCMVFRDGKYLFNYEDTHIQTVVTRKDSTEYHEMISLPRGASPYGIYNRYFKIEWLTECKYELILEKKVERINGKIEFPKKMNKSLFEVDSIIGDTFYIRKHFQSYPQFQFSIKAIKLID